MARNNTKNNFRRKFIPDIAIVNAHISGRPNFSGAERTHQGRVVNSEGNRNFCIDIPEPRFETWEEEDVTGKLVPKSMLVEGVMVNDESETVLSPEELIEQGWPLKIHNRSDDDSPSYYMPIKVNFSFRPPCVYTVVGDNRIEIDESMIDTFDGRTFSKVDLIVHPSVRQDWDSDDISISAYLKEGWFYIALSPFEKAWNRDHPEENA